MSSVVLRIEGMDCPSCAAKLERALSRVEGIEEVSVSLMSETATLTYDTADTLEKSKERIQKLGYSVGAVLEGATAPSPLAAQQSDTASAVTDEEPPLSILGNLLKQKKIKSILAFLVLVIAAYGLSWLWPTGERYFFTAALAVGLFPVLKNVLASWSSREFFTIETLLAIAAIGAVIIGEEEEAAIVVLLFLIGEFLEGYAANRARNSIQALKKLAPSKALLQIGEKETREVDAQTLKKDDIIIIRPGDSVAADGVILDGNSTLNEASLTGESVPRLRTTGDEVFASTINLEGTLTVRVSNTSQDNMIARVVRLVEQAQDAKAPTQRFIDRFAYYYTPFVLLLGIAVATIPPLFFGGDWGGWFYKALAVLLIGCPCALVISTPAAIVSALARGARNGLLIKGGEILERVGKITKAAFDKTGTLTEGKAYVTDIIPFNITHEEFLALATGIEVTSSHPLADAIRGASSKDNISGSPVDEIKVIVGKGVSGIFQGQPLFFGSPKIAESLAPVSDDVKATIHTLRGEGKSVSVLVKDKMVIGLAALRDEPREDAKEGLQALKDMGIQTLMITGDSRPTADAIGKLLGMDEIHADLLPEDKLNIIKKLQKEGSIVAKIGDGINDAPGLATADVGIAMGQATDVALETADAALLSGRVGDVARLVSLSRQTMTIIHQNITLALGLKAVFFVTTLLGITGLWPAILADTGATVLVTINSMRMLRGK